MERQCEESGMTYREAYEQGVKELKGHGVPDADLDAFYLLEHASGGRLSRAKYLASANRLSALTGFPVMDEWVDLQQVGLTTVKTSGRFSDFCYTLPSCLEYECRLDGVDDDWHTLF